MILVILGIGLALLATGIVLLTCSNWAYNNEWSYWLLNAVGGFISAVALIATICLGVAMSNLAVIDDKISMYQEENTRIEEQISATVTQYQEYETEIFTEVKPESSITLVALYPELKSDTLVQEQIRIYTNNNQKIKELKELQINGTVIRWWLYFGK